MILEVRRLKSRSWQGSITSGGFRKESIFLPFAASRGCLHYLDYGLFLALQRWSLQSPVPSMHLFVLLLTFLPPSCKDLVIASCPSIYNIFQYLGTKRWQGHFWYAIWKLFSLYCVGSDLLVVHLFLQQVNVFWLPSKCQTSARHLQVWGQRDRGMGWERGDMTYKTLAALWRTHNLTAHKAVKRWTYK